MKLLTRLINAPVRLQKCVAAALVALALTLACVLTASVFAFFRDKQEELAALREKAGRLAQIAAMKGSIASAPDDSSDAGDQTLFLEAESLTIGRANLQSRVDAIAQNNGLLLSSAGGLPDLEEKGLKLIGLRVDFSGGYDAVHKAVMELETSMPPLMLREVAVRLASGEGGDRPLELAAEVKLFAAFRQTGAPESGLPK